MTTLTHALRRAIRRDSPPETAKPLVIPSADELAAPVDIPENDPLIPYLESAAGAVDREFAARYLEHHGIAAEVPEAMRAWADGDALVVEVEDDGAGMELSHRMEDPDLDAEQGRGMYVVRALTDDLTVRRVKERTVVRAVRRAILPG